MDVVKKFIEQHKPKGEKTKSREQKWEDTLKAFQKRFPKKKLQNMTLEDYCIGNKGQDNFCWWLEIGLKPLGTHSPGTAKTYRLYYDKKKGEYSKNGYLKDIKNDQKAMADLAGKIHYIVDNHSGHEDISNGMALKILHSYYPEQYFPIYSRSHLRKALELLGAKHIPKDRIERNEALLALYWEKCKKHGVKIDSLHFMKYLYDECGLRKM